MAGTNPELVVAAVIGRAHAASHGARLRAAGAARRGTAGQRSCSPARAPASLPLRSGPGRHHGGPPPRARTPAASSAPARRRRPTATTRPGLSGQHSPSRGTAPVQGAPATRVRQIQDAKVKPALRAATPRLLARTVRRPCSRRSFASGVDLYQGRLRPAAGALAGPWRPGPARPILHL